jgi:hypothetical protein
MYQILAGFQDQFRRREIVTDNFIFRLQYVFTTVLLFTFSLLVTATEYVGNPIECINDDVPIQTINTFCWFSATFTIPNSFMRTIGEEVPFPGKLTYLPFSEQSQVISLLSTGVGAGYHDIEKIPRLLPVGQLYPFFPSSPLLFSKVAFVRK